MPQKQSLARQDERKGHSKTPESTRNDIQARMQSEQESKAIGKRENMNLSFRERMRLEQMKSKEESASFVNSGQRSAGVENDRNLLNAPAKPNNKHGYLINENNQSSFLNS